MTWTRVTTRSNPAVSFSPLSAGPETPIQRAGTKPTATPVDLRVAFTIGASGLPVPYIVNPPTPKPGDGPADIRIMGNWAITLTLDDARFDCEFRNQYGDGMTLGPNSEYPYDPANPRYKNLYHSPPDGSGRCKSITFEATYFSINDVNLDPYNLYIRIYLKDSTGASLPPIKIRFDPDIRNPGDHGFLPPPPAAN